MSEYQNRNASITVGTSSQLLTPLMTPDTGERVVISVKNTSTNNAKITLAIGLGVDGAVSGAGIVLNPGESWTESRDSSFEVSPEPYYVISDVANGTIAYYERRLRR